jgi:hypothetical protein
MPTTPPTPTTFCLTLVLVAFIHAFLFIAQHFIHCTHPSYQYYQNNKQRVQQQTTSKEKQSTRNTKDVITHVNHVPIKQAEFVYCSLYKKILHN